MKKLLLPISFCVALFLMGACHNSKKANESGVAESKSTTTTTTTTSTTTTTTVAKDTTAVSGTAGEGKGINKDSLKPVGTGKAIIHPVPNQEKIDSIKKAKTKKED